jgi:glycosyltransferase involved in cell wall biosynthesis
MKTSLIITTYNQPEYLRLALLSALEQTQQPDEIIIADDGSDERTAAVVREFQDNGKVKIIHTWQKNEGFRPMHARNNAVAASSGEYLIFLDGDCYLEKHFIEDHLSVAEVNHWVCGTRVNIKEQRKEYILRTGDRKITFFSWGTNKKFHAIRSKFLSRFRKKGGMASANFACWRSDFEKVNGFNERLAGFSGCDAELSCRFNDIELPMKKMVHLGIAYHFAHTEKKRVLWSDGTKVVNLMEQIRREEKGRCQTGLNRALAGGYEVI